jgi:tetratricopeptide (TPR) repeat protein
MIPDHPRRDFPQRMKGFLALLLPALLGLGLLPPGGRVAAQQTDASETRPVTAADALAALKASVDGSEAPANLDMDGDGMATSNDARMILQRALGKEPSVPESGHPREQDHGDATPAKPGRDAGRDKAKECSALWSQAHAKSEGGDAKGAITGYRKVLELCPDKCSAMNNIGVEYQKRLNKLDDALEWFEKAARCNPEKDLYRKNLEVVKGKITTRERKAQCDELWDKAHEKAKRGDPKGSITDYRKVLELCPDKCSAMNNIGSQYFNALHDPDEALSWFRKALACDPGDDVYKGNVANAEKGIAERSNRTEKTAKPTVAATEGGRSYAGTTSRGGIFELFLERGQARAVLSEPGRGPAVLWEGRITGDGPFRLTIPRNHPLGFTGEVKGVLSKAAAQGSCSFGGGPTGVGMTSDTWSARLK